MTAGLDAAPENVMRPALILIVLCSVCLSAGSQILLKWGMSSPDMTSTLAKTQEPFAIAVAIGTSLPVLLGLMCFGLSAVVWLFVLAKIPLSTAYPFVALGIAITVMAGRFLFDEPISMVKLIGIGLIVSGVAVVSVP